MFPKVFVILCLLSTILKGVHSSAIPMWEFLSKQEKMSYLYSMFANQVEDFCRQNTKTMPDCNLELLKYGLNQLKEMSEDDLDTLDPYQRGADNMIWDSMMVGHTLMKTTPTTPVTTTTAKPNSYEDESFGNLGAASAKIDVYRVRPPTNFIIMTSGQPEYVYPSYKPVVKKTLGPYTRFTKIHPPTTTTSTTTPAPVIGPMVVKVYPDGRPVVGETQLPQDDDLRQYQLSSIKIPNLK